MVILFVILASPFLWPQQNIQVEKIKSFLSQGQWSQAAPLAEAILNGKSYRDIQQFFELGRTFLEVKKHNASLWVFRRLWLAFPDNADQAWNYGLSLRLVGEYRQAKRVYQWALTRFPNNGRIWSEWGLMHQAMGEWEQAERGFRKAHDLGHLYGSVNLGNFLRMRGHSKPTLPYFRTALNQAPKEPWPRLLYGLSYVDSGSVSP